MISVTGLTVRVPGFVLDRVSFMVPTGMVGVVTGPTGAGKTTLLESIAGVRDCAAGKVMLGDADVTRLSPERRDTGLVYQHAWLFPHLTVHANVRYGASRPELVTSLMAMLHIDALLDKPVATLSGGERQLVALARAMSREPRTLLLDEPFAAMDSALRAEIRTAVLAWGMARGATTLLVTHDAVEAALDGSVPFRLDRGRLTPG